MTDDIRLVCVLSTRIIHRADCPLLMTLSADQVSPFHGLERTLCRDERETWCLCVMSIVAEVLARSFDRQFVGRRFKEPPAHAQLVRWLRGMASTEERLLRQWGDEIRAGRCIDDESSSH